MAQGADVEIRFSLRPSDMVYAEPLARDVYYPVCAPSYAVTLETLAEQPLFDCMNMMGTWAVWNEEQGLTWPNPPVTLASTYSVALSAAASGAGLCLAHDAIAARLLKTGQLIAPFAHRAQMQEGYYLIQTPQAHSMPAAQTFIAWLRAELETFYLGRDGSHA